MCYLTFISVLDVSVCLFHFYSFTGLFHLSNKFTLIGQVVLINLIQLLLLLLQDKSQVYSGA